MISRRRKIAICGFDARERDVLLAVCQLSETRDQRYQLVVDDDSADALVVDFEHPQAFEALSRRRWPVAIGIGRHPQAGIDAKLLSLCKHRLSRPIRWAGLLAALDQNLSAEHDQLPADDSNEVELNLITPWYDPEKTLKFATEAAILVATEDHSLVQVVRKATEDKPYRIDVARDVDGALDRIEVNRYNIAFIERELQGDDGFSIVKALKNKDDRRRVAAVVISPKTTLTDRVHGMRVGCDAYMNLPVTPQQVRVLLERFVPKWERDDAAPSSRAGRNAGKTAQTI